MFIFNLKRTTKDLFGHLILIVFPVVLIAFFNFIYTRSSVISDFHGKSLPFLTVLTVGFSLTFQIHGASLGFETIGLDFFSPMKDRLSASPGDLRKLVISILMAATIVSFLQTLVVLLFSVTILNSPLPKLYLVVPVMLLSIIFHQLLGSVIMLSSGSVKTSNAIISTYASVAPMLVGLYFPLPDSPFFLFVRNYSTPMALANTAIKGIIGNDTSIVLSTLIALLVLTIALFLIIRPLIKKVAS